MMVKVDCKNLHFFFLYTLFTFVSQIACHPVSKVEYTAVRKAGQAEVAAHGGKSKTTWKLPRVERSSKVMNNLPSWMHGLVYPFDDGFDNGLPKISQITKMLKQNSAIKESGAQQQHIYSPIISTRVFSMPQFLDEIKHNLESMKDEEDFPSVEIERVLEQVLLPRGLDQEAGLNQPAAEPKRILTKGTKSKSSGRRNHQHFVDNNQSHKNGYTFGLG